MDPTRCHLDAVLGALMDAKLDGVTGPQLVEVGGWRFGASIHTLRRQGWPIESKCEEGRIWRYTLTGRPA